TDRVQAAGMADKTFLQSGGGISGFAEGDADLGQLVTGATATSGVTVRAGGAATLGFVFSNTKYAEDQTAFLDVEGASIETHGALTSGVATDTGYGIRLVVGPSGDLDILGQLES